MRKITVLILSLSLIFTLTACDIKAEDVGLIIDEVLQVISTSDGILEENDSDNENDSDLSDATQSENTNNNDQNQNSSSSSDAETASKETVTDKDRVNEPTQGNTSQTDSTEPSKDSATQNNTPQSNAPQSNTTPNDTPQSSTVTPSTGTATDNKITSEKIDNGVLQEATSQKMSVPENMKLLDTDNIKEENNAKNITATVALYKLDGNVVSWMTEDDLIYVITLGNNRLVVIDSKTMMPVSNIPLAGKPAEINLVGQEIYISLPDLCRIDIFSKSNNTKTSSLYFEHEVSSFCVDSNYIFYSEHDQHCDVYRKNLTTNELTKIGWTFYQPKLYLNKQDNILYIGESDSTGSTLYYYDATTLQLKSLFRKNNYGIMNHTRDIFHVDDEIFWGNYRLSDVDANQIEGRYGVVDYGSVNFASKELVSTFEGIFLADTYECVVNYFDAGFKFEYILVSDSYNVFFRTRSIDQNIIIGVNFDMQ